MGAPCGTPQGVLFPCKQSANPHGVTRPLAGAVILDYYTENVMSTQQQSQVASATPLFYKIAIPYEAILQAKFDPNTVKIFLSESASQYQSESLDAQSTFSVNSEKETLLFLSACAGLECGKRACELVLTHTPFERIKTLIQRNIEAKGFGWIDRELHRLEDGAGNQIESFHQGKSRQ